MQGIELSRRFYNDVVRPWLSETAPDLRHAAALSFYGSELLGFDDETSRDHNWGPRVQLFVSPEAFAQHARPLVDAFAVAAPSHFLGEPIGWRSRPHPPADHAGAAGHVAHGLEIHTIESSLETGLGIAGPETLDPLGWLGLSEQKLLAFTAAPLFHDDDGRLGAIRAALAYFPRDVWLYKIACQWRRIAEEQAFVGRAGQVGDDLGSRVIAARLARDVMRMGFLLERRYAPYPKWFGSAFARLPIARSLAPLLDRALAADDWPARGEALAEAYLVLAQRQIADGIGGECEPVIGPYFERPFATINADDLVAASMGAIADPRLSGLAVIGSLDQVSDATPVLTDTAGSRRMMEALLGGNEQ